MEVVWGQATVASVDQFLGELDAIASAHGVVAQAVDARYVAGETHLACAARVANRAIERGQAIASDPSMELLLAIAATRQIDNALTLGVSPGVGPVAIVIEGDAEQAAAQAARSLVKPRPGPTGADTELITSWFEVTDRERAATTASLEALVCERVVLLALEW